MILTFLFLLAVHDLCPNVHLAVVASGDIEWMAREIELVVGDDKANITEESATRIPSRIIGSTRICPHCYLVLLAVTEQLAHVDIESQIAIVGCPYMLSVHIDIAHKHHASEVEHHPSSLPFFLGCQFVSIPAYAHLLEPSCAETAFHIIGSILAVGTFVCPRCHPGLIELEVMRQVDDLASLHSFIQEMGILNVIRWLADTFYIAAMELPSPVDIYCISHRSLCCRTAHHNPACHEQHEPKVLVDFHPCS